MDPQTEQIETPVFGAMIGILTGQRVDTGRLEQLTTPSARHSLWEGPDAFDPDELPSQHPPTH